MLQVISSSPGELEPVFNTMLENAVRICEAQFGEMFRKEDDGLRLMAHLGVPEAFAEHNKQRGIFVPTPGSPLEVLLRNQAGGAHR